MYMCVSVCERKYFKKRETEMLINHLIKQLHVSVAIHIFALDNML